MRKDSKLLTVLL